MGRSWTTGVRNFAILAALATLFTFWREGFDAFGTAINQVALLVFVVVLASIGWRYFSDNRLKWLVIRRPLRWVIIACAAAIVALLVLGPWLLADHISMLAVWALIAVLAMVIVQIVVSSRRER